MTKKSSVSRMQSFTYFQILCYVLDRDSWDGWKIHHNTELFRYWPRDLQLYSTLIPDNADAGGSAICIH